MITYDSNYSILYDIAEKLGIENLSNESTFSRTYDIYVNETDNAEYPETFDSIYSIAFEIYKGAGGDADAKFDSTYSICYAIYQLLGGEEIMSSFDSTYSILEKILDIDITKPMFYYTTSDGHPIDNTFTQSADEADYDSKKQMFYLKFNTLPTTIPNNAFLNEKTLASFIIPEGVTTIGASVFYGCSSLTSIVIPDSVTDIGSGAFHSCSNLASITIPDGVTKIGNSTFTFCSSLTSIVIPDSVTSIGSQAFLGCSNLVSVTIGNSVTTISSEAFSGCSHMTTINIPDSVTSFGTLVFNQCSSLPVEGGIRYADTFLVLVIDKTQSTYTIKEGTRFLGDLSFSRCTNLTSINIPDSVISIGQSAFSRCTSLNNLVIGSNVSYIGTNAFAYAITAGSTYVRFKPVTPPDTSTHWHNPFNGSTIYVPEGSVSAYEAIFPNPPMSVTVLPYTEQTLIE